MGGGGGDEGEGARRVFYFSLGGEGESNYNNSFKRLVLHTVPMKKKKKGRGWEGGDRKKKKKKKKKRGRRRNRFPSENVGLSGVCRWQSGQCDSHLCGP